MLWLGHSDLLIQGYGRQRGRVVRALALKSGGPGFKPSTLQLIGFVLGCPEFNSLAALCK